MTTTTTKPTTTKTTTTTTRSVAPVATESTIQATILKGIDCTPEVGRLLQIDRWIYGVRLQSGEAHYANLGGDVFEIKTKPQKRRSDGEKIENSPIVVRVEIRSWRVTWRGESDWNPWVRVVVTAVRRVEHSQPEIELGAWMRVG